MPGRNRENSEAYDLILTSTSRTVRMMFDRRKSKANPTGRVTVPVKLIPFLSSDPGSIQVREWQWSNGKAGAGWGRETPASRQEGGSAVGEFVFLRRLGVAQPAGQLVELTLPSTTAGLTTGWPTSGQVFGANNDLYVTTRNQTVVKVPSGTGDTDLEEKDFGVGSITVGLAVFNGAGTACLYVGDGGSVIHVWNGSAWSNGEPGTERTHLATVNWNLGEALASGGLAGTGGAPGDRLVGVKPDGTGIYHVADDPKINADWSAFYPVGVGGSVFPILGIASSNHVVWFGTGLGVLSINELGETPNQTKWVELIAGQADHIPLVFWNELLWFSTDYGLVAFSPDGTRIDLGATLNFGAKHGVSSIYGRPTAIAPCPDGLLVGYYNRETDTGYVGCLLLDDQSGAYRWSMAEAVLPGIQPTYLQQVNGHATDGSGDPHLFIGGIDIDNGHHLFVQDIPTSGDPETDAVHSGRFRAAENWSLTLSRWDDGTPNPKSIRRHLMDYAYIGDDWPDNTLTLSTSLDDGAFVVQGTATQEGGWTGTPAAGSTSGKSIQIKISARNAPTVPIVLYTVALDYSVKPRRTKVRTYPCLISEQPSMRNGRRSREDPGTQVQQLEQMLREDDPITVTPRMGRPYSGFVEEVEELEQSETVGGSWVVKALVTISTSRMPTRYDVGDSYDVGAPYS